MLECVETSFGYSPNSVITKNNIKNKYMENLNGSFQHN